MYALFSVGLGLNSNNVLAGVFSYFNLFIILQVQVVVEQKTFKLYKGPTDKSKVSGTW